MPLGRSDYFLEVEQALLAYGRAAGVLSSTVGLGRAREKLISDGLSPHLPGRISIERGEMVDGQGKRSGEVDTVLVDTHRGRIQVGAESLVPVEAATAAIEVKTDLSGDNLKNAVEKIAQIKRLIRTQHHGFYRTSDDVRSPRTPIPPSRAFGVVLAFRAPSWENIYQRMAANPQWYDHDPMVFGPDRIVILGRGVAIKNDQTLIHGESGTENLVYIKNERLSGLEVLTTDVQELLDRYGGLTYDPY